MSSRIVIVGTTGSGKSTLALQIAAQLDLPHIELDRLYWDANWTAVGPLVFLDRVKAVLQTPAWVIDGNYRAVRDVIWQQADTLIWLDFSFSLTFFRLFKRCLKRLHHREGLWAGNRESFYRIFLSRESILIWFLQTYWRRKREYAALLSEPRYAHLQVLKFTRNRDVQRYLSELQHSAKP